MNPQDVSDFSSSLYLAFYHQKSDIGNWKSLSNGKPAVLDEVSLARKLGNMIAHLQGTEAGILAPSTLHLFFDWFNLIERNNSIIFYDDQLYAVGKNGIRQAACNGVKAISFPHLNAKQLLFVLRRRIPTDCKVIIVTDGICPVCGRLPDLTKYLRILDAYDGLLVIDDTQGLGIIGSSPTYEMPYGFGGGGILKFLGIQSERIILISSLAKGFGVPVAVISGSKPMIDKFLSKSMSRTHHSQVSMPLLLAVKHAVQMNKMLGDNKRLRLFRNVRYLQDSLIGNHIKLSKHVFPVQRIEDLPYPASLSLFKKLKMEGIQNILMSDSGLEHRFSNPKNGFILRADHTGYEIRKLTSIIKKQLLHHPIK